MLASVWIAAVTSSQIAATSRTRNLDFSSSQILIGSLNIIQANCQLVVKGNNYIPDYAPFAVDKQGKLIRTELQIRVCSLLTQI